MLIDRVDVNVTSPGRNFVTLKITTKDGITGYGDATLNGRELSVASYLRDHLAPLLTGRDAHLIEDTWQYLYRGGYWRRGPVTMAAIAAVDTALWDIKAKAAGMPLYQLLGGAGRDRCLVYGHASGADLPELKESIHEHLELGFRAIRIQTGVPGLDSVYGVASSKAASVGDSGRYDYEPARRSARPAEERWDTRAYLRHVPSVFEEVRNTFGEELALLHDAHHRLTPLQAARLGKSLEPYDLFWLEDVTPAENQEALRLVRQHTITPLAIGEVFNTIWDYQTLISEQLIDYVRSPVTHAGGITGVKKIADYAAMYQIKTGMHGPTDVSPVGQAAAVHLGIALHNFGIQEYMIHSERTREVFGSTLEFADGGLKPSDEPGLGVHLDERLAADHPYEPAYLPTNRLLDGTVHDWWSCSAAPRRAGPGLVRRPGAAFPQPAVVTPPFRRARLFRARRATRPRRALARTGCPRTPARAGVPPGRSRRRRRRGRTAGCRARTPRWRWRDSRRGRRRRRSPAGRDPPRSGGRAGRCGRTRCSAISSAPRRRGRARGGRRRPDPRDWRPCRGPRSP
ncbi:enolase superfamily enzyme related to L-alanine-DL-glutamate epimerase [Saccharomonospora azurea NA-128]|uniref:Enolase superfamily enzyme related to L-alanine-DL-glutamate epimerase n=1 Tax=Saccharomonospora azurea NA-128 TaxID=882081 RepID=H8G461_9PSEU|nr:enolase superfamily enzyme related to L-alanine-DL-glutamate epimerase [Saccharomonospora azurea NA-128]